MCDMMLFKQIYFILFNKNAYTCKSMGYSKYTTCRSNIETDATQYLMKKLYPRWE